ncbi:tetratricopeptide repeat protein [Streptomyces lasalocidi]
MWFDSDRQNLTAIQESAARAGLHRLVWQLALIQREFHTIRHQFDDFLAVQQIAVVAAQASGDQSAEALMLSGLGSVYWKTDRLDEAEDSCLRALQIYRTVVDPSGEGLALVEYGAVQGQRGNNEGGVALFTQALDLLQGDDTRRARATALQNRGVLQQRLGNLAHAVADTRQALAIYRQLGDRRGEALAIGNLAWFHLVDADIDSAFDLYREQQRIALLLDDTFLQADALFGVGETHATAATTWTKPDTPGKTRFASSSRSVTLGRPRRGGGAAAARRHRACTPDLLDANRLGCPHTLGRPERV